MTVNPPLPPQASKKCHRLPPAEMCMSLGVGRGFDGTRHYPNDHRPPALRRTLRAVRDRCYLTTVTTTTTNTESRH